MIRKEILPAVLFLLLCCGFSGFGAAPGRLLLVTSPWPPFEFESGGTVRGTDADILREAFRRMKIPLEMRIYPWLRAMAMVQDGSADGVFSLRPTADRRRRLLFPGEPVSFSENAFFYRQGERTRYRFSGRLQDLRGLRIGITRGYAYGRAFMNSRLFVLDEAASDDLGFRKLEGGRIDLFLCDRAVGIYMIKKMGLQQRISVLPVPLSRFQMFVAFRPAPELRQLLPQLDRVLREMRADGTMHRIRRRYY